MDVKWSAAANGTAARFGDCATGDICDGSKLMPAPSSPWHPTSASTCRHWITEFSCCRRSMRRSVRWTAMPMADLRITSSIRSLNGQRGTNCRGRRNRRKCPARRGAGYETDWVQVTSIAGLAARRRGETPLLALGLVALELGLFGHVGPLLRQVEPAVPLGGIRRLLSMRGSRTIP